MMVRFPENAVAASIVLSLVFTSPAVADPISFQYAVEVVTLSGPGGWTEYRPPSFEVVATFDDQVTADFQEPDSRYEYYGRVRFSSLPRSLPVPSAYDGRPLIDEFPPDSENGYFAVPEGGWGHTGRLGSTLHQPPRNFVGGSEYSQF